MRKEPYPYHGLPLIGCISEVQTTKEESKQNNKEEVSTSLHRLIHERARVLVGFDRHTLYDTWFLLRERHIFS